MVMLVMTSDVYAEVVAYCLERLPEEACGMLAGPAAEQGMAYYGNEVCAFYPARNAAGSARLYTVDPLDHLRADRDVEMRGLVILGVVHSHTHTEPYPSPVDIDQAPDPKWHYVIVGLGRPLPTMRVYSIHAGQVIEKELLIGGLRHEHAQLII